MMTAVFNETAGVRCACQYLLMFTLHMNKPLKFIDFLKTKKTFLPKKSNITRINAFIVNI